MDAITMLREDHRTVERLFKAFQKAGPNAQKTKQDLVERIIRELVVHAAVEEQVFYPAVRESVDDTDELVLESLEEHHVVKWVLSELADLSPDDERYTAKANVLVELVRSHVEEEEGDLFPAVRQALGRKRLAEIGTAMDEAKKMAPTRPHPRQPDTPPANVLLGAITGFVDKARDVAEEAVQRVGPG